MKTKFKTEDHTRMMWEVSGHVTGPRRTTGDYFSALVEAESLEDVVAKVRAYVPAGLVLSYVRAYRRTVVLIEANVGGEAVPSNGVVGQEIRP